MKWKIQFAHCIFILYVRCTCDFSANALNFKTIFQLAPDVEYFSCNKKVYPPPLTMFFTVTTTGVCNCNCRVFGPTYG